MTGLVTKGSLVARFATEPADVETCQRLRYRCFIDGTGARPRADGRDRDRFDDRYQHVMVRNAETGVVQCTFRILLIASAPGQEESYAAQFYDVSVLRQFGWPQLEMGRFCLNPDAGAESADVLRVAWAALTRIVDELGVTILFGCSSFAGTDPTTYTAGLSLLRTRHLGPMDLRANSNDLGRDRFLLPKGPAADRREALRQIPPLLRTYLQMGGWVSDHGVIDRDLNTFHLLTAVEIGRIPTDRAQRLRDLVD